MRNYRIISFASLLVAIVGCGGSVGLKVTQVPAGTNIDVDRFGVVYTLPRTELTVSVPITKTTISPGQFYTDLEKLSGSIDDCGKSIPSPKERDELCQNLLDFGFNPKLTGPRPETQLTYKIGDPEFKSHSIQDPNHVYMVEVESGAAEDALLTMAFEELGFLSTVTSERSDRTIELSAKAFQTVAELAIKAIPFGVAVEDLDATRKPNIYAKANAIFDEIRKVRANRQDLYQISQSADISVEAIKHARQELDRLEASLLDYFIKKRVETWSAQYSTASSVGVPKTSILTFFHMKGTSTQSNIREAGICGWNLLSFPVPETFQSTEAVVSPDGLSSICQSPGDDIKVNIIVDNKSGSMAQRLGFLNYTGRDKDKGLRYRVPGLGVITINRKKGTEPSVPLARHEAVVAQFGQVMHLPAKPGGTKTKTVMGLFAETGALKTFEISSTGAAAAAIEGLGTVGNAALGIVEARRAAREAEAAEESESAKLKQEVDLLKLKKEKAELEKALADLATGGT